jgi:hypothetical protein
MASAMFLKRLQQSVIDRSPWQKWRNLASRWRARVSWFPRNCSSRASQIVQAVAVRAITASARSVEMVPEIMI